MLVALAADERFGEKFVSVCSAVYQRVHKDSPLLLLSALCTSLAFCQVLIAGLAISSRGISAIKSCMVAPPTYVSRNLKACNIDRGSSR